MVRKKQLRLYTIPPSQPMFVSISAAVETDEDAADAAEFCVAVVAALDGLRVVAAACDVAVAAAAAAPAAWLATVEDAIRLFVSGTVPLLAQTPRVATEALLALVENGEEEDDESDDNDSGEDTEDGDAIDELLLLARLVLLLMVLLLLL